MKDRYKYIRTKPGAYYALGLVFLVSRALFYLCGGRFDATSIFKLAQFADPELLKNNLWQTVYYLHIQPPLFNLFLGWVLKVFPGFELLAFNVIYELMGIGLAYTLYLLMEKMGVRDWLRLALTNIFIISPACLLYENWLFFTYPLALLLTGSALALFQFAEKKRTKDGVLFFTLLAAVVLIRSLFHLVWFVLFLVLLATALKKIRGRVVLASLVPLLILLLFYLKNLILFGTLTSSSWLGVNLARESTFMLSSEIRKDMSVKGELSLLALTPPFPTLEMVEQAYQPLTPTGIPVLDQKNKSTRYYNFNHQEYLEVSKFYWADAVKVIQRDPGIYLKGIALSFDFYFMPASNYIHLDLNRKKILNWDEFYDTVFLGRYFNGRDLVEEREALNKFQPPPFLRRCLFLVLGLPVLAVFGWLLLYRSYQAKTLFRPRELTLLFLWANIIYVTLVGNALEIGENHRLRFMIDPFFAVLLGLFLQQALIKLKVIRLRG